MKPTTFPEVNENWIAPQDMTPEQCATLPSHVYIQDGAKVIVSRWKMSFFDRIKALLFGVVWLYVKSEVMPQVALEVEKNVFEE